MNSIHTGIIDLYTNLAPANNSTGNKLYYCHVQKIGEIYYQFRLFFSVLLIVFVVSSLSFLGCEYWYALICSLMLYCCNVLLNGNCVCECVSFRYRWCLLYIVWSELNSAKLYFHLFLAFCLKKVFLLISSRRWN